MLSFFGCEKDMIDSLIKQVFVPHSSDLLSD